jgi:RNA-directed DNA polymerase
MQVKARIRDRSIGTAPAAYQQRKGVCANFRVVLTARRCVRARSKLGSSNYWSASEYSATNAWNQNWNTSNPGNQNNTNKTNAFRVRAVRRKKAVAMQCDVTVSELFQAYFDCRKTKRNTWNALAFEERMERNLMGLYHELHEGSYHPGRSMCFVVEHPKVREVWAADFRDRVVHHLLYNRVSGRFYRRFIHDSYACIPEKGALKAVDRLEAMARSASQNFQVPLYFLKVDVANFFVSIQKPVLDGLLARHITEPWWMELCRRVLHHDPTKNVLVRSPPELMARVPTHKSLFSGGGQGLPIGNLSSQFFANVYLDPMDQFAKHQLKLRWMARYVDDVVALGHDAGALHQASVQLDAFIGHELGLRLHPNKTEINRIERGVSFLGYIVRPHARYVRRSTLAHAHQKIASLTPGADPLSVRATANSYLGLMRHANAWRERGRFARALKAAGYRTDRKLERLILKKATP